jgi:hypothetical protein
MISQPLIHHTPHKNKNDLRHITQDNNYPVKLYKKFHILNIKFFV